MSEREERTRLVPFRRSRHTPDPARVAEFAATARKIQAERALAAEQVEKLLKETPRAQWPRLVNEERLRTHGALEQLSNAVEQRRDRNPVEALAVAEIASSIAASLADYPGVLLAQMRSQALKDRAQVLCALARYDESLATITAAEELLEPFGALGHDVATLQFTRANVLQHLRRFDEASQLLEECRRTFHSYGDTRLSTTAAIALGNLLVRRGDYRAACQLLQPLAQHTEAPTRPIVLLALGWCAVHLNAPDDALEYFTGARAGFRALGRTVSELKAAYGVASALLHLGRLADAAAQFSETRDRFLASDVIEEAGLSGLGMVEVYLLRNENDHARDLAARIVHEFSEARLNQRAIAALAYLNEAIAASNATPDVARSVCEYILALQLEPTCEFAVVN
ncbi:MAG: tetratricopeptide repeat protein [Acidobacteria bacterium]|nr:tetratricopeptide repeat protein [Acidobacteriota bacterium]MBV9476912.1 tetratricopeptide repeat protein [Acidobacteriota bacterium]